MAVCVAPENSGTELVEQQSLHTVLSISLVK